MTNRIIKTMDADEIALTAGGVTEGPNGNGCTRPRPPLLRNGGDLWGGPIYIDLKG